MVDLPSLTLAEVIAKVLIGLSMAIKLMLVRIVRNCSEIGLLGCATVINLAPLTSVSLVALFFRL